MKSPYTADAETFAHLTNDPEVGGASYHLLGQQFLNVGVDRGHMVGGHPYSGSTTRVPETKVEGDLHPYQAHAHFIRTAINTGGEAYAGSWKDNSGVVTLDASTRMANKRDAIRLGQARGEEEIFDSKKIESYPVPKSRKKIPQESRHAPAEVDGPVTYSKSARGSVKIQGFDRSVNRSKVSN